MKKKYYICRKFKNYFNMYKKFLLALTLGVATLTATYASFPVEREEVKQEVVSEKTMANDIKKEPTKGTTIEKKSSPAAAPTSGKSQLVALLLAIFVGGIGIHRFYLGYTTQGIIQLLTLGGCGVWSLIDLIRIITGDLKPKGGDYAQKL